MKTLKTYSEFKENAIKEEFVGKLWRDLTGKNKDRIKNSFDRIFRFAAKISNESQIFDNKLSKDFEFRTIRKSISLDTYITKCTEKFLDELTEKVKADMLKNSIEMKINRHPEISKYFHKIILDVFKNGTSSLVQSDLNFLKDYSDDEFSVFSNYISLVESDVKSLLYNIKKDFFTDLFIWTYQESQEIKKSYLRKLIDLKRYSPKIFYYLNILSSNFLDDESRLAAFIKSLVLRLKEKDHEFIFSSYEVGGYHNFEVDAYKTNYSTEYGIDYIKKIDVDLSKTKISELKSFKELKAEVGSLKDTFKVNNFIEELNLKIEDILIFQKSYSELERYTDTTKLSEAGVLEERKWLKINKIDLASLSQLRVDYEQFVGFRERDNYSEITLPMLGIQKKDMLSIDFEVVPKVFNLFEKEFGNKTINDVLKNKYYNFKSVRMLEIVEKDTNRVWVENDKYFSGNVIYHGSIHYNLDKPGQIKKLIYKEYPYKMGFSEYGMYLTTHMSAAAQYQYLRAAKGTVTGQRLSDGIIAQFEVPKSEYFPTIYRVTLKPGTIFEYKPEGDTTCSKEELKYHQRIGSAGWHSGSMEVGGGETVEITIVDDKCVEKIEKVKPSEILNLDDNSWREGSRQLSKEEFLRWYKDLIQKRKENND